MSSYLGKNLHVSIFGQSHAPAIGVTVDGLPAGERVDLEELDRFLQRRAPGRDTTATPRKEADKPRFLCGLVDNVTCGAPLAAGRALLPAIDEFDREDLVWTDLSTRPRVHVVRSGLLLSKVYTSDDQEFPYALFSEGFVSGLTELYTPFVASSFYYLQGIIPGQICRFDSDDVREIVDGLPASQSLALANITLMNSSTANYGQILTLAHGTARDKVASVLVRIVNQLSAHGEPPTDLPLTHSDVALIAHLERATASRELKGLAKAGAVELGYRLIRCRSPSSPPTAICWKGASPTTTRPARHPPCPSLNVSTGTINAAVFVFRNTLRPLHPMGYWPRAGREGRGRRTEEPPFRGEDVGREGCYE